MAGAAAREAAGVPTPLEWTDLAVLAGRYPGNYSSHNIEMFEKGAVAAALRDLLGARMATLKFNLSTVGPLTRFESIYFIYGSAPHRG